MTFNYKAHQEKIEIEMDEDPSLDEEDRALEAEMASATRDLAITNVEMKMKITKMPKPADESKAQMYCVEFSKVEGDALAFTNAFKYMTKDVLKFAVDDPYLQAPVLIA